MRSRCVRTGRRSPGCGCARASWPASARANSHKARAGASRLLPGAGRADGLPQLVTPEARLATARRGGRGRHHACVSTASNYSLEDMAAASAGPLWFQLYCYKDRGLTRVLVERARAAGYRALVLTADTPMVGRRERDIRNRFTLPPGMGWKNVERAGLRDLPQEWRAPALAAYVAGLQDAGPDLGRSGLAGAQSAGMPVLVKGVPARRRRAAAPPSTARPA